MKELGAGLNLHAVQGAADAGRFIALNEAVTGEGGICERLLHHHPRTSYKDYWLVEDQETGTAASTTCLIPWHCYYEGVRLEAAMLEMVVTDPAYRRQGLVRAQVAHFHHAAHERGFDLCLIQGIPYYYRQYGYAYALDHTPAVQLKREQISDAAFRAAGCYWMRLAEEEDVERLTDLYALGTAAYPLHVERSAADWLYLLRWTPAPVRLVFGKETGLIVGYVRATLSAEGEMWVSEGVVLDEEAGLGVLGQLGSAADTLRLGGGEGHTLVRLARDLGSSPLPAGQWLLRLPDVARFLRRIGPAFESRLARAGLDGLDVVLCLNLYREAFRLRFAAGRLEAVEELGFVDSSIGADGGDLCIPPDAFVRLAFGYRDLETLRDAWPDIMVKEQSRAVWEALFPPLASWIWTPY